MKKKNTIEEKEENEDSGKKKNYENNEIDVEDTDCSEAGYSDDDAESNRKKNDETDEETETDSDTDEKEILKSLLLHNQFKKRIFTFT